MKEAFIFLLMARSAQFFIDDKGSKRYIKGFIGIITSVIILQSFMGVEWSKQNLRNDFSHILNQLYKLEPEIALPEEIQQQNDRQQMDEQNITIDSVSIQPVTIPGQESDSDENEEYMEESE